LLGTAAISLSGVFYNILTTNDPYRRYAAQPGWQTA
jgi:hypothetical protein